MTGKTLKMGIGVAVVVAAAGLVWALKPRAAVRSYRLPDGTALYLENVAYGKFDPLYRTFDPSLGLVAEVKPKLLRFLPASLAAKLNDTLPSYAYSSGMRGTAVHTNLDNLRIWISKRHTAFGSLQNLHIEAGEITGDDGFVYWASQSGEDHYRTNSIGAPGPAAPNSAWLSFEAFPRRERKLRLRVWDQLATNWAEFVFPNPAPIVASSLWVPQELPIARTAGRATFVLTALSIRTNQINRPPRRPVGNGKNDDTGRSRELVPSFQIQEDGEPSDAWRAGWMELWDESSNVVSKGQGNFTPFFLNPREPAWKLVVRLYGDEQSRAASNETWTIRGLNVPPPGGLTLHEEQHAFSAGTTLWFHGLAGPGRVVYSNGVPAAASTPTNTGHDSVTYIPGRTTGLTEIRTSSSSQIALRLVGLGENQRLTVRAVDDQQRSIYADDWASNPGDPVETNRICYFDEDLGSGRDCVILRLPADSKTVDLYFCLHNARTGEFVFKPPGNL